MKAPKGFVPTPNQRIVSVDGDADRVIYSYTDSDNKFHLLDGDRIASLGEFSVFDLLMMISRAIGELLIDIFIEKMEFRADMINKATFSCWLPDGVGKRVWITAEFGLGADSLCKWELN